MKLIYLLCASLFLAIYQINGQDGAADGQRGYTQEEIDPPTSIGDGQRRRRRGMTFVKQQHLSQFGVDIIGCRDGSPPSGYDCNPYIGDTPCSVTLPVLCMKVDGSPRPPYFVGNTIGGLPPPGYMGWNRGHVATTLPVRGSSFGNLASVDAHCVLYFGAGWRTAQFHDGIYIVGMNGTTYADGAWTSNSALFRTGGWRFLTYGDVQSATRFWVHIRDQPANCWSN